MFIAGCNIVIVVVALFIVIIHGSKLKHLSYNSSEACFFIFHISAFPTNLQMQILSLPAGGTVGAGEIAISLANGCNQISAAHTLFYQALQER